jgi:trk system potassium uptake protein
MLRLLTSLPFFVLLMGIGSAAMLVPAVHALVIRNHFVAESFAFAAVLSAALTFLVALATRNYAPRSVPRSQLTALLAAFVLLPALFAVPFHHAVGTISFLDAWFEMVSSFTTTGATLFDNPGRLEPSLHLWRALTGWLGGLLVWVMAVSILAPMNLGGFEVTSPAPVGGGTGTLSQISRIADPSERLARYGASLAPIYAGLTGLLWIALVLAGEVPWIALCHAMAVLSTSGISPVGGLQHDNAGPAGEIVIFAFLFFAVSRLTFSRGMIGDEKRRLWQDPEIQVAFWLVIAVTVTVVFRHALGATERDLSAFAGAFWGAAFTALSFLTTTGFESRAWTGASDWSGLSSPGLVLLGLAVIGGGVATTAGGIKLMRAYALYKHGVRELERVVHPSSVGGAGLQARRIRRQGAYVAWVFFVLFAISVMVVMLLLSLTGLQFEPAMVLTVAALTTTGPLAQVAGQYPISYAGIPDSAQVILALAMVLGRLETLALIALFNPEFWRS